MIGLPPNITITMPDNQDIDFNGLLVIDREDLPGEYARQAAWLGYIGMLAAEAEAAYETSKNEADAMEAEKDAEARLAMHQVGFTEPKIKNWIRMDADYIAAQERKIEALRVYKRVRAIEKAMFEKGNMLVSLGATMRQEMDMTDLKLRFKRREFLDQTTAGSINKVQD